MSNAYNKDHLHKVIRDYLEENIIDDSMREVAKTKVVEITVSPFTLERILQDCFDYVEKNLTEEILSQRENIENKERKKFLH